MTQENEIQTVEGESPQESHSLLWGGQAKSGFLSETDVEQLSKEIAIQDKIRSLVVKVTKPNHWETIEGQPYLNAAGVRAISTFIGISTHEPQIVKEALNDDQGDWIMYTCTITATFRGRQVTEVGTASTRDPFFGKAHGQWKPLSEIALGNVKKKSVTNAKNRAIKSIIGIDFDGELLSQLGVDTSTSNKVSYDKAPPKTSEDKDNAAKAAEMVFEMFGGDKASCQAYCTRITSFTTKDGKEISGKPSPDKWSAKQLNFKMKDTIQPDYDKFVSTGEVPAT